MIRKKRSRGVDPVKWKLSEKTKRQLLVMQSRAARAEDDEMVEAVRRELLSRKKTRVGRDADNPRKGDVFESRTTGRRWRVTKVEDKNVVIEPAGSRTERPMLWSKSNLKGMKYLRDLEIQAPPVLKTVEVQLPPGRETPEGPPTGILASLFGAKPANEDRDPSGKRRAKSKARGARRSPRKAVRVQSLVFQKRVWDLASARRWAKMHGFLAGKVDETRTQYRFRQAPPKGVVASKRFKPGLTAVLARKGKR